MPSGDSSSGRAGCSRSSSCSRTCTGSTGRPRRLLDGLVESLVTAPILLLVNYGEYSHGWAARAITPSSGSIAAAGQRERLLGAPRDDPSLEPIKHVLVERTEGDRFFLEESARTLVETGRWPGNEVGTAAPGAQGCSHSRDRAGSSGCAHRSPAPGGQAPSAIRRGYRKGCPRSRSSRRLRRPARSSSAAGSRACRPPSFCTRRRSSRISSTRSSTR